MAEKTSVSGTVAVESDGRHRVAFDLMRYISGYEEMDKAAPRRYWLELYRDCLSATYSNVDENIKERPKSR